MIDLRNSPLSRTAWRLQNLYAIKPKNGSPVKFRPNYAQRRFYNEQWYCNHVLKARQLGLSTFIALQNLDAMLFMEHVTCGIVDYKRQDAEKKLAMIKLAYDLLDDGDIHPETWRLGRMIKQAVKIEKSNTEELRFSNGSSCYCGVSLRGGTVQRLHISELGKTAFFAPTKAEEIRTGALNTVAPGQVINIESTHEGGKIGLHYSLLKNAMKLAGQELTEIDFAFHFFPWWQDRTYRVELPDKAIREEILKYFEELREREGIVCDHEQMLWYDRKEEQQGFGMLKEFPSTPGEALNAIVEGAIYGVEMARMRADGRVRQFSHDGEAPLYVSFDIGNSDKTAMWLVQQSGRETLWLDWYETNRKNAGHYADKIREWEGRMDKKVAAVFLPHDSARREVWSDVSAENMLHDCGIDNIVVVPRIHDIWVGIKVLRELLRHSMFHSRCDQKVILAGEEFPSGIDHLEAYHTKPVKVGQEVREAPFHDESSHTADAARTFAEAWKRGLVHAVTQTRRKPRNRRG